MMTAKHTIQLLLVALLIGSCSTKQNKVSIYIKSKYPQTEYAINNAPELFDTDALQRIQSEGDADVIVSVNNELSDLKEEGFVLSKTNEQWQITGKDPIGAMYGIFEVAEQLSFGKEINEIKEKKVNPLLALKQPGGVTIRSFITSEHQSQIVISHVGRARSLAMREHVRLISAI